MLRTSRRKSERPLSTSSSGEREKTSGAAGGGCLPTVLRGFLGGDKSARSWRFSSFRVTLCRGS